MKKINNNFVWTNEFNFATYIKELIDDIYFTNRKINYCESKKSDGKYFISICYSDDIIVKRNDRNVVLIKNTYKVLLTRGLKGCYIYCEDKALLEHMRKMTGI